MIKLKEIISQLDEQNYREIENELVRSKAKNFHFLLTGLRDQRKTEKEICSELQISNSAFYALKSRLMDKIQEHLSSINNFEKEELMKVLSKIPELCNNTPRETANAILQKLENDLIKQGMHNELLMVYSSLKKVNLYSPKYFTYSQLFNKSVAYSLSLEKAEEIACEFSRIMSNYLVSRDASHIDSLNFLRNEIRNVFELNNSKQIAVIKNVISIQYAVFCHKEEDTGEDIETLLRECHALATAIPDKLESEAFLLIIDYLSFEYYFAAHKTRKAEEQYEKVVPHLYSLLLLNHKCSTLSFLQSRLEFCSANNRSGEITPDTADVLFDPEDTYTRLLLDYYTAVAHHRQGNTKKSVSVLNNMINQFSLPNMFHMEVEVKLLLSHFLYLQKEFDMADSTLKKLMRKIKTDYNELYAHVEYFSKILDMEINKENNEKNLLRKKELLVLFMAYNKGHRAVLNAIVPELKQKYQI